MRWQKISRSLRIGATASIGIYQALDLLVQTITRDLLENVASVYLATPDDGRHEFRLSYELSDRGAHAVCQASYKIQAADDEIPIGKIRDLAIGRCVSIGQALLRAGHVHLCLHDGLTASEAGLCKRLKCLPCMCTQKNDCLHLDHFL